MAEDHARSIATIGLLALILAVTADGQPHVIKGVSLDTITVSVPLAILACLPYMWRKGIGSVPRYLLGMSALLFLACGLVSAVANGGHLGSLLTVVRYASYFVLAIVVSVVTRDPAVRRLVLWTIALSGAATAVLAVFQYANPQLTPGMHGVGAEITTRVVGTFYNSNFYAEYLILVFGVVLALMLTEGVAGRILSGLFGVLVLGALLLTYTRGSWIGLAVGLLVFVVFVDIRYLVVAAVGAVAALFVPGVMSRLQSSSANASSADFRLDLWQIAGEAMKRRPIFGYGPGNFLDAHRDVVMTRPELFQGYMAFGAHNSYFELAAEIGILGGFMFFVVTVLYATRGVFIAARAGVDRTTKYLALGLSVGLIGLVANTFTSNTFQHPQSGLFFWILSGVVAGLGVGLWDQPPRPVKSAEVPVHGVGSGSLVTRWALWVRSFFDMMWRASTAFAWTSTARSGGESWLESSVVLRAIFGARKMSDTHGS